MDHTCCRFSLSIYIYIKKNVCLSVCLFAIRFHTVQLILMKLSRNDRLTQVEVDVYFFFEKKTDPTDATCNLRN